MTTRIRVQHLDDVKTIKVQVWNRHMNEHGEPSMPDTLGQEIVLKDVGEHEIFLHDGNRVTVVEG